MRILVTGGNGFLGSHIVEQLAARGHELQLLLRRTSRTEFLEGLAYQRVDGDMRDAASLERAVQGVEAVVHCAGLTTALSAGEFHEVNAYATGVLTDAAVRAGVRRFVYVSSLAARGPNDEETLVAPETPRPLTAYGRSKLAGETALLAQRDKLEAVIVRPPVVYGPRDRALVPMYRIARLGVFPLLGDGQNQVSWVYASDAAAATAACVTRDVPSGRIYTFSDGQPHTWRELVASFGEAVGRKPLTPQTPPFLYSAAAQAAGLLSAVLRRPLPLNPDRVIDMRQRYWLCDNDLIKRELGWAPSVRLQAGMALTLRWYREQGWL